MCRLKWEASMVPDVSLFAWCTGSERLALLSPKDSAHDFERRQIKTTTTPEEDDSQPASFTPREGLDESSAKTLTPELGSGVHEDKSIVWYKNRQVCLASSAYLQLLTLEDVEIRRDMV